ncbi:DUF3558 domain-containing protein [Nocardia sp. NPDC127579]|uniref:DUF3558 domain-containing protein n=1 Tax=Nocardia sp. NPDC127579 TaxID=3345402 RepID=UPI00363F2D7A
MYLTKPQTTNKALSAALLWHRRSDSVDTTSRCRRERVGMSHRIKISLIAALVATAAAACGTTKGGSPTPSTAPVTLWNPCTEISDEDLRAAGLRPETEETGIGGVRQDGMEICAWRGKNFFMNVYSVKRSAREVETREGNIEFEDVQIAGRTGRQFRVQGTNKDLTCDVVFSAAQGAFELSVLNNYGRSDLEDPCVVLQRVGNSLVPLLPS